MKPFTYPKLFELLETFALGNRIDAFQREFAGSNDVLKD